MNTKQNLRWKKALRFSQIKCQSECCGGNRKAGCQCMRNEQCESNICNDKGICEAILPKGPKLKCKSVCCGTNRPTGCRCDSDEDCESYRCGKNGCKKKKRVSELNALLLG